MKALVIAEKPSVGRDLASVLNCRNKRKGYLEGERYIVTWALGHLVTLAEPQAYDKKYKQWQLNDLPMLPEPMRTHIIRKTAPQMRVIQGLINRKDISEVIIATDAGREGELVARWILLKAKWKGAIRRLWLSSQTEVAIKEAFQNLKPGKNYLRLYDAAVCRSEADWLIGLNVTRALTCKYDA
ncbi:MAG: DNA topoisomerase III, partial [Candidatus Cloacimonetes bacterium]|nr:DNA topoisomerase III [Candidatus Cloacimonadota bacterium]